MIKQHIILNIYRFKHHENDMFIMATLVLSIDELSGDIY